MVCMETGWCVWRLGGVCSGWVVCVEAWWCVWRPLLGLGGHAGGCGPVLAGRARLLPHLAAAPASPAINN